MNRIPGKYLSLSAGLCVACFGCSGSDVSFHYHEDNPRPRRAYVRPVVVEHHHHDPVIVERTVVVPSGHVCTPYCDHYYDGARYIVVTKGHVHGPGCGHEIVRGRWVVVGKARAPYSTPQPERKYVAPPHNTRR
jgi:hypothetical protein